jgi:hypothetical protein
MFHDITGRIFFFSEGVSNFAQSGLRRRGIVGTYPIRGDGVGYDEQFQPSA